MTALSPEEWQAVALSLRVALWATSVSLPIGIFVAYGLARWEFPGRQLINGLVHLPLILPPQPSLSTPGARAGSLIENMVSYAGICWICWDMLR